jgi:predicted glycosyltransferase involved in capsule biosynthesis
MPQSIPSYSVVITTFDKRFNEFLVPLIADIKNQRANIEIIVTINGPGKGDFDDAYRSNVLRYLAGFDNVFPLMFPRFQSLAKMWNRGVLTASNDRVLVLNDDLSIEASTDGCFFDYLESAMFAQSNTFIVNGSFSHFIVNKRELIEVGFFDERLLGLGEEDGDFFWRYYKRFEREIPSIDIEFIHNVHSDIADDGYTKGIRTASKFNRDFVNNVKYKNTLLVGYRGMFDQKVKQVLEDEKQYPYEQFYLDNKNKL